MTIGDLSEAAGIPASTIRYWERISVLPKPARTSGQRRYSSDSLHRLAVLRLAQSCGFRLDEMRHLLHGFSSTIPPSRRWQEVARHKREEIDQQIDKLRAMRKLVDRVLACECPELAQCGLLAASVLPT